MKTVKELYDELGQLIKEGYGDTRIIANCEFNITKGNGYYNDFPLSHLKDIYYQSGDIELEFSQEEEFTEENKYKDDNNGWHDLVANPNDLPKEEDKLPSGYKNYYVLPSECKNYYVIWFGKNNFSGAKFINGKFYDGEFVYYPDEIVAWKEIIPPKE